MRAGEGAVEGGITLPVSRWGWGAVGAGAVALAAAGWAVDAAGVWWAFWAMATTIAMLGEKRVAPRVVWEGDRLQWQRRERVEARLMQIQRVGGWWLLRASDRLGRQYRVWVGRYRLPESIDWQLAIYAQGWREEQGEEARDRGLQ
ncbi:MAG: hypothetical protein N2557_01665 [Hydrogenophilus sp.]|nr:hypothetical protein [Hydrogenophilus sp.]